VIEEALRDHLLSELGDLVGNRVYPLRMMQNAQMPAIVYQRISTSPRHRQGGPASLTRHRFQIDCWARTYGEAAAVACRVQWALDGRRGRIGAILMDNASDDYDEEAMLYRRSLDVMVWEEGV
jgi:hypothetical protein